MEFKVLYDSKRITSFLILGVLLLSFACKSSGEAVSDPNQPQTENAATSKKDNKQSTTATPKVSNPEAITVTYTNHSSNIQIKLDPAKDQFYLDLSGMTPQEKDSIIVKDSTLIQNRAIDIQSLLASFRKAQDLFYLGEYNEALKEIDKTIQIQETADAFALKGTIFFMLENVIAAKANWNKAVQMDPNIPVPSIPELEKLIEDIRGGSN